MTNQDLTLEEIKSFAPFAQQVMAEYQSMDVDHLLLALKIRFSLSEGQVYYLLSEMLGEGLIKQNRPTYSVVINQKEVTHAG